MFIFWKTQIPAHVEAVREQEKEENTMQLY